MNLIIYNGNNSQQITVAGLTDINNQPVTGADITGTLLRNSVLLPGGIVSFSDITNQPGSYVGILGSFDAACGSAQFFLEGDSNGLTFSFTIPTSIIQRTM